MYQNKPDPVIVVLIGYPGSGKTTYAHSQFDQFSSFTTILDGDTLKTSSKVVSALKSNLDQNRSVIIDATNMSLSRRNPILKVAKDRNIVTIYAVHFTSPIETCLLRVKKREQEGGKKVPPVALYSLKKHYVKPNISEGFLNIVSIDNTRVF